MCRYDNQSDEQFIQKASQLETINAQFTQLEKYSATYFGFET